MKRTLARRSALLVLPVLAVAFGIRAGLLEGPPATEPNQVVEIAPGVWFRHGDLAAHGHCNNGFVVFKDFVLVIDANFPSGAEACLAEIRKVTDKPVRFVFDTHHHGDHAYGNPVWLAKGVIPVAHENVKREMQRLEPARWKDAAQGRDDVRALGRDTALPPIVTYPDRMVFDDGTQRVELLHFGTAHTRGDGFAWLPRQRVLFTGDAVVNGPYNFMGDGNTHSWIRVIDALADLGPAIVAPGHGPCSDGSLLARQQAYIRALHDAVDAGIAAGKTAAELRDTVEVPEPLRHWVGTMFRDQVTKVFVEKRGLEMPLELEELGLVEGPSPAKSSPGWEAPRKVIVAGPASWKKELEEVAPGVEVIMAAGRAAVIDAVADADAVIGTLDKDIFAAGKKLRWAHSISAGVNQYVGVGDGPLSGIPGLAESALVLTNGKRCYGPDIADQVFAYVLAFSRWVKTSIAAKHDIEAGRVKTAAAAGAGAFWRAIDPGASAEWELRGKRMLIVGAGGIGSETARRAAGFGMEVVGIDPDVTGPLPGFTRLRRLDALMAELPLADVVVIACPWTRATHRSFGAAQFAAMKSRAILINIARGAIVEREALIAALESGKLLGAGLDVTDPEPLPDGDPLWKLPNVIITPHNAGQSDGVDRRKLLLARENLRRFAAGERLLNVVDKRKGY